MQLSMRRPLFALSLALCCVTLAGAGRYDGLAPPGSGERSSHRPRFAVVHGRHPVEDVGDDGT